MSYLKSLQVKSIYPSAYRNATFDLQADNTTEYNMTNVIRRIGKRSYVVDYDQTITDERVALRVSLGGYLFEITGLGVTALKTAAGSSYNNIYLYIRTASSDGSNYNAQLLEADGTGTSANELDSSSTSSSDFYGLGYSFSAPSNKTAYLKVFRRNNSSSSWEVPSVSYVILDSAEIGNGSAEPSQNTIAERFDTKELAVDGDTFLDGDIEQEGDYQTINGVRLQDWKPVDTSINDLFIGAHDDAGLWDTYIDLEEGSSLYIKSQKDVEIYTDLTIGQNTSGTPYTGSFTLKSKKPLLFVGNQTSGTVQALAFSGTSTFQAGDYASVTTTGQETITVGGNLFNILTRDTPQGISANKTFTTGILTAPTLTGFYGQCDTAGDTAAKLVTITNFKGVTTSGVTSPIDGAHILVRFAWANTASKPTLNVNNTGNKALLIREYRSAAPDSAYVGTTASTGWSAYEVVELVYSSAANANNGAWVIVGHQKTSEYSRTVTDTSHKLYLIGTLNSSSDNDTLYVDNSISMNGDNLFTGFINNTYAITTNTFYAAPHEKQDDPGHYDFYASIDSNGYGTFKKLTLPSNLTAYDTVSTVDVEGTARRAAADGYGANIKNTYAASLTVVNNGIRLLNNKAGNTKDALGTIDVVVRSGTNAATTPANIDSSSAANSGNTALVVTLGNSGVTANTYGNTSAQEPGYGSNFNVPYFRVNNKGIIIAAGTSTVKIPATDDTDTQYTFATGDSQGQFKYATKSKGGSWGSYSGITINNLSTSGTPTFSTVTVSSYFNVSDKRLKENIKPYECEKSILDLPIYEFDYKKNGKHSIGCLAQDLQEICPQIVSEDKDGYLSIEENKLVYLLLQEVKLLKEEIIKLRG